MTSRLASLTLVLGTLGFAPGCFITADGDSTLTVFNDSDFVIEEINVTEIDDPDWGPDLLGGEALFPDESVTIELDCDTYDARLIDEDDVECFIDAIDLCFDDAEWVIRNNSCPVFGIAARAREAGAARPTGARGLTIDGGAALANPADEAI